MGNIGRVVRFISLWPPYLGAGIKVTSVSDEGREISVQLKKRIWNQNIFGVHFGGSLYAMCDPFYTLILVDKLGPEFIVWDKAATIRFRKPAKGNVFATFAISRDQIERFREAARTQPKIEPRLSTVITNADGTVVAEVEKTLYIRSKNSNSTEGRTFASRH